MNTMRLPKIYRLHTDRAGVCVVLHSLPRAIDSKDPKAELCYRIFGCEEQVRVKAQGKGEIQQ